MILEAKSDPNQQLGALRGGCQANMDIDLRRAIRAPRSKIALANAADGVALGINDKSQTATIATEIERKFTSLPASARNDAGLLSVVDTVCRGDFLPGYKRGPSSYLKRNLTTLSAVSDYYSTVVHGAALARIISSEDLDRVFGSLVTTTLATAGIPAGSLAERRLMDRSAEARARRLVMLDDAQVLGNVVLWLTRRPLLDAVIDGAIAAGVNRAVAATDALGLVLPRFDFSTPALNHRYMLHVPGSVVARKAAFRPTFVEAGGYPRFKARPASKTPTPGWGLTLDLDNLAGGGGLADGLEEITLEPLTVTDFRAGETLELEYLGALPATRGEQAGVDCDETVAKLLMNGRSCVAALREVR